MRQTIRKFEKRFQSQIVENNGSFGCHYLPPCHLHPIREPTARKSEYDQDSGAVWVARRARELLTTKTSAGGATFDTRLRLQNTASPKPPNRCCKWNGRVGSECQKEWLGFYIKNTFNVLECIRVKDFGLTKFLSLFLQYSLENI